MDEEINIDFKKYLNMKVPFSLVIVLLLLMFCMLLLSEKQIDNCNAYWLEKGENKSIVEQYPLLNSEIPPLEPLFIPLPNS